MTIATALNIVAATIGFSAAAFFCIGNIANSSKKIIVQSTPYWDFNEPVALALAAQRAQYVAGAMLLVISFLLQVAANLASSTTPANLPQCISTWPCLVFAVLVIAFLLGWAMGSFLYKKTMRKIKRHIKKLEKESNTLAPPVSPPPKQAKEIEASENMV